MPRRQPLRERADLTDTLWPAKAILPAFIRELEVHDLVLAAFAHLQEPVDQVHTVVGRRDHLLRIAEDRPFDTESVAVVRVIGEPRNDRVIIRPAPVDFAARPDRLPSDDPERADVVEAVFGEELKMLVEARTVVLVGPRGPEQGRAEAGERSSIVRYRTAADADDAVAAFDRVERGSWEEQ